MSIEVDVCYTFHYMNFTEHLKKLNHAQLEAVETTEGPVMVVAGPGTGKTQVLTLRIANILQKTDTEPSSILCLTFTRSGVHAMRQRLEEIIGTTARNVTITTFHSFANDLIEKHWELLDFSHMPKLLEDNETISIVDELLENETWEYLRPRTDPSKYFHDVKSLISLLKRERITPDEFLTILQSEIKQLQTDPDSISSRGPSKGKLKAEIEKKIVGLHRTIEVVVFYKKYEQIKTDRNLMDYDDVLEYAVNLAEGYDDVRADLYENYQYVLVDEHQDSSQLQNSFLRAVWGEVERPNIFIVGDDRQLIYGFSGANIDYFTEFKTMFGRATMITLTENYRSTAPILAIADELLQSSITTEKLTSNTIGNDKLTLSEFDYSRDEIIGAGLYFKKLIDAGTSPEECALLLPKNAQVKNAVTLLRSMDIPVVSEQSISLLHLPASQNLLRVLGIIANPNDSVLIAQSLLDSTSGIPPLQAHQFLKSIKKSDTLSLADLTGYGGDVGLFSGENPVSIYGRKLENWITVLGTETVPHIISVIGNELLIDQSADYEALIKNIEIVRSFIHACQPWSMKNPTGNLSDFLAYFARLNTYGNSINVANLAGSHGVTVMTLHKSKGLEYDHVWIGHMNQEIISSDKPNAFNLPEKIKEKIAERDILTIKRELYVAITRARKFCTISFADTRDSGGEMKLADVIADLSDEHFIKLSSSDNQKTILEHNPRNYALITGSPREQDEQDIMGDITRFVSERFSETKISVSMLNNFFECPWKWYFRNFLKLPETKGISLALGSAVHNTIEFILKSKTLPTETEIKNTISFQLEREGVHSDKDLVRLGTDAYIAIKTWIDMYYNNLAKNYTSERSISFRDKQFPNLSMYGKIDLTERSPDGSIIVTDFKTGTSKTSGVIEKIGDDGRMSGLLRQLAMYSYLIAGSEGNTVHESRLLFLEEDKENKNACYRTRITDEQIQLLIRDIADYQNLLTTGDWTKQVCTAKTYGTGGVCEYCDRIKRILE